VQFVQFPAAVPGVAIPLKVVRFSLFARCSMVVFVGVRSGFDGVKADGTEGGFCVSKSAKFAGAVGVFGITKTHLANWKICD